jgi:CRISPR-associated protein Cmr6
MYMYSGPKLIEALAKQHEIRSKSELFKSGTFTLGWRAKVGSFPHADTETIVSAGEPCGAWSEVTVTRRERNQNGQWQNNEYQSRPEDKRNVGENCQAMEELPLYGYIPAASIRGIVRAWASQYPALEPRMKELLGYQTESEIIAGKIEFLDAFPTEPTKLSLDIVNPQQNFQVFHQGQSTPLSLYTLGDGHSTIEITVAIRGKAGAKADEVNTVWEWVQQALSTQGIGSRNASGYGALKAPSGYKPSEELPKLPAGYSSKILSFTLYSQGNAGPDMKTIELRPTHWRGWLRSWLLRFFLGVMSPNDAKFTVGELLGTLEESSDGESRQGTVRLRLIPIPDRSCWGKKSQDLIYRRIYKWKGQVKISAPRDILNEIILPIIKIAVQVGGVGKGWRRPLHCFVMNNDNQNEAARGCHLELKHKVRLNDGTTGDRNFGINLNQEGWSKLYNNWKNAVKNHWRDRYSEDIAPINAEVFSPRTCAVYLVNGPYENPIDSQDLEWLYNNVTDTRGEGMNLIYQPTYKREPDVGGDAGFGNAHCSWVSIKRINKQDTCQEVVCIFMGDGTNQLRSSFLQDLSNIDGAVHLFGQTPQPPNARLNRR